ncbi:MAG: cas7c [Oscillospiraceae bacterium]|nr:cas7c [Oscillospiraceae bacterium]
MPVLTHRYDFVAFLEVKNGNPNGDPDADGMPRFDMETGVGWISDVCIKRKIRDYIALTREGTQGYEIYVRSGTPLERNDSRALQSLRISPQDVAGSDEPEKLGVQLRQFMCRNFYDIRAFGAVMTSFSKLKTALNCGQIKGPVQLAFAESVEPVAIQEVTISRCTVSTEREAVEKGFSMGRKFIIPYGLYRMEGCLNAALAQKSTGFDESDLELFWEALERCWGQDQSAGRGKMALRQLITFQHDSILGNCPSYRLQEAVTVSRSDSQNALPARQFQDYAINIDDSAIPRGIIPHLRIS